MTQAFSVGAVLWDFSLGQFIADMKMQLILTHEAKAAKFTAKAFRAGLCVQVP